MTFPVTKVAAPDGSLIEFINCAALLAWMDSKALLKRLLTELRQGDFTGAIPHKDRPRLLEEVDEQILELQREEEAIIRWLQLHGVIVPRDPKANGLAVLALRVADKDQ